jgi:tRNA C32,U32 (ribose-2'-O)-methylase TrmJ
VSLDDGEDDDVASAEPVEENDTSQPFSRLSNVCFVLCRPQGPANVGGIARVMNNFGITDLRIVAPEPQALAPPFDATMDDGSDRSMYSVSERSYAPLADEARIMAVHASGLLENAGRFETADAAVADCVFVAATTARPRENLPIVSIRDACRVDASDANDASDASSDAVSSISAFTNEGKVAILFGNEATGLTNEELALANVGVMIPTAGFDVPDASGSKEKKTKKKTKRYTGGVGPTSLNLSHAVGVCAYEVHQAIGDTNVSGFNSRLITAEERVRLADELHAARRATDVLSNATNATNENSNDENESSRLESLEHARERRAIANVLNAGPIASRDAAALFSLARRVVDVSRFSGTDAAILQAARAFDSERVAKGQEPLAKVLIDSDKGRGAVKALIKAVRDACGVSMTTRETERVIEALGKSNTE